MARPPPENRWDSRKYAAGFPSLDALCCQLRSLWSSPAPSCRIAQERAMEERPKRRWRRPRRSGAAPPEGNAQVAVSEEQPLPPPPHATARTQAPGFAHPSEAEFAGILNFYGLRWSYEPRSFPLRWEDGKPVEMLTPDFYLPELDLYLELTTLKQSLVTEKNRKLRRLRELYPEIHIKLLYKRDYHRLLAKYGFGPLAQADVRGIDKVLISTNQLQKRVGELGRQISEDYAGKQPLLVGVLRGVLCFMADLMREISLPVSVDFMAISYYSRDEGVRITKDLDLAITGRDVILVEDIVDTGMTLRYILHHLESRRPASVRVVALLDKRVRRIAEVPVHYMGFEVPDEFLVGYGLDYLERYRNLPFIGVLKPEAPGQQS
ncbi:MAG: hypoxanthine phosphoribosyltransferase [Chloroflexi bacterium]|nr:hypoxanthine phosphoribosyltransferase [Chloroflexota bacterium]